MSQETKKMLAIIDKQHKEAYEQIQKENKQRKLIKKIIIIGITVLYIALALDFIFIY